ncbi:MAG: hypothetical protein KDC98_25360 [Planctomycetes bacterium]|nr:hypothetical protein [Planctomycetota bacterium]
MNRQNITAALTITLLTTAAAAQGRHFLFTTTQPEQTLSGSAGTVLDTIRPNEIASLEFGSSPCTSLSAEKWAPRTMFHTQAGDTDNDDQIWESNLFGRIDAVLAGIITTPVGIHNQRTIFYSVDQAMGTTVSGAPGFRPGDVARIVRAGSSDGQIEYFLTAENLELALGLSSSSPTVNIDACAFSPNMGVFFSIEDDTFCNLLGSGPTLVRDGDILCIPAPTIGWSSTMTVSTVLPGSAVVVYPENVVDAMVLNARITERNGVCVAQIIDVDALEIDQSNPFAMALPSGYGPIVNVPHLLFAGSSLTGAGVLDTLGGGSIHLGMCGQLGTNCGFGPTFGDRMGLQPTSATQGCVSSINGLAATYVCRFVTEAQNHQIPVLSPAPIDIASPGLLNWMLIYFAPMGPGVVSPSQPFPWGLLCYPDYYTMAVVIAGPFPTPASGFANFTTGPIPFPVDLVFQAVTITSSSAIEISTPTTVEVY